MAEYFSEDIYVRDTTRDAVAATSEEAHEEAHGVEGREDARVVEMRRLIGGHIRLEPSTPRDSMFQCFLTNSHGHFAESRVRAWSAFGVRYGPDIKRIAHGSYVTFPWSSKKETYEKSLADIRYASRCVNALGMWGLNIHLPKEYHISVDFENRVAACFAECELPCVLLFEIVGSSTRLVSEGKLPPLPIHRMRECQVVIERVARRMHRENHWGFCFDTAHAFVQGQPLSSADDVASMLACVEDMSAKDEAKGGVRISAIHLNGSKWPFKSGRDQHTHAGGADDHIWGEDSTGLRALLQWIVRNKIPTVLERAGMNDPSQYTAELQRFLDIMHS